jgi:hypothetical protein
VRMLTLDDVTPEETPVQDLIRYLTKYAFQVVVRGKETVGVVDVSDLYKNPVYGYFYILLSLLEQGLSALIRQLPANTDWESKIGPDRWKGCEKRWRKAKVFEIELDQLYYLYFVDYLSIVATTPRLLRSLSFQSREQWEEYVASFNDFRRNVMHPVRDLVGPHRRIGDLFGIDQRIRELTKRTSRLLAAGAETAA